MSALSPQLFVAISVVIVFTYLVVGKAFFLLMKKLLRMDDDLLSGFDVIEKFNFFMVAGLSASFLIASVLTPFGLFFTGVFLLVLLGSLVLLIFDSRKKLTRIDIRKLIVKGDIQSLAMSVFVMLMVGISLYIFVSPFMGRIGPVSGDCRTHMLIVSLILEKGRLPLTLQPYWNLPANYPMGSHVPIAFVEGIYGFQVEKVFTVATLLFSALASLSLYNFCKEVFSDKLAALVSILLLTTAFYPLDNATFMNISFIFGFYATSIVLAFTTYTLKRDKLRESLLATPLVGYVFTTHPLWVVVSMLYLAIIFVYFLMARVLKKRDLFVKYVAIISLSLLYSAFSLYQLIYFQQHPLQSDIFTLYDEEFKIQQLENWGKVLLPHNLNSFFFGEWGLPRYSPFLPFLILLGTSLTSFLAFFLFRKRHPDTLTKIKRRLHWLSLLILWYFLLLVVLENNPAGLYFFNNPTMITALPPHRLYASMEIPLFLVCSFAISSAIHLLLSFTKKVKIILETESKRVNITRFLSKTFIVLSAIFILITSYLFAYQPLYTYYEKRISTYDVLTASDYDMMKWIEKHLPNESLILATTADASQYIPAIAHRSTFIIAPLNTEPVQYLTQNLINQPNNLETLQLLRQYSVNYIFVGSTHFPNTQDYQIIPEKLLFQPPASKQELAAYWIYTENEAIDISGNDHHGLIYGSNDIRNADVKLNFDGMGDYIKIPYSSELDITSNMTIEAWINVTDYQDYRVITTKWGTTTKSYYLGIWRDTGQLTFSRKGLDDITYTIKSNQSLTTGIWHHIAAVSRGKMLELYIDGELVKSDSWYGKSETGLSNIHICHNSGAKIGSQHFRGVLSKLTIYNRALSAEEIKNSFERNAPTTIPESPYYKVINQIGKTYLFTIAYP